METLETKNRIKPSFIINLNLSIIYNYIQLYN